MISATKRFGSTDHTSSWAAYRSSQALASTVTLLVVGGTIVTVANPIVARYVSCVTKRTPAHRPRVAWRVERHHDERPHRPRVHVRQHPRDRLGHRRRVAPGQTPRRRRGPPRPRRRRPDHHRRRRRPAPRRRTHAR